MSWALGRITSNGGSLNAGLLLLARPSPLKAIATFVALTSNSMWTIDMPTWWMRYLHRTGVNSFCAANAG